MNDKISFIADLLNSKKITVEEKTRVLDLTKGEFGNINFENSEIKRRLNKIEIQVKQLQIIPIDKDKSTKNDVEDIIKFKMHSPKTMVKFLYSFSIDEKYKWFTHNPEGLITEFDYRKYIKNADKEFNKTTGWNINNRTYHNIKNFIINTGEKNKTIIYGKGTINYSWRDLEQWCNEHPNMHPYDAELSDNLFKKYINQFKQIIEFRTDEADLTFNLRIRKLIRDKLGVDFQPNFTDSFNEIGQSLKIFCDINLLLNAIEQLINWIIINKAKSIEVEINLVEHQEYFQLEIIHKNSYWSISPDDEKLRGLSGDFDKVRKTLFSVADWEMFITLKANEVVGNYKIICLNQRMKLDNNKLTPNIIEKSDENLNCIKHILKLYKTQNL